MPFPRGSSQPRDQIRVSCIAGRLSTDWASREAFTIPKYHVTAYLFCSVGWQFHLNSHIEQFFFLLFNVCLLVYNLLVAQKRRDHIHSIGERPVGSGFWFQVHLLIFLALGKWLHIFRFLSSPVLEVHSQPTRLTKSLCLTQEMIMEKGRQFRKGKRAIQLTLARCHTSGF